MVKYIWGLTGSLLPNGLLDLFGQQLMLDGGAALGRYITHYRDQYFQLDYNGFDYHLIPGAEKRIVAKIAPYWLQMSAEDYLQMPALVNDARLIDMEHDAAKTYAKMKRDMLAELPSGVVTAANAAACYSKLSQMANGAVYVSQDHKTVAHIHDGKLDAVEELVEELDGQPLLLAYEFQHDVERLRERFGKDLPCLGKGTTPKQEDEYIAKWNRNELPILACHPASAGHGLNLQEGSAAHVCWFGVTWDLELYDQFIRRIRRSGNVAQRIFNHLLIVRSTIDELKLEALGDKDLTQTRLLKALNLEITHAGGDMPVNDGRRLSMVTRLSRQSDAAPNGAMVTQAQPEGRVVPRGWGSAASGASQDAAAGQRERIQEQIAPSIEQARSAFSGAVAQMRAAIEQEPAETVQPQRTFAGNGHAPVEDTARIVPQEAAKPTRSRKTAEPVSTDVPSHLRLEILKIAFNDPATSMTDGMEIAKEFLEFVRGDA